MNKVYVVVAFRGDTEKTIQSIHNHREDAQSAVTAHYRTAARAFPSKDGEWDYDWEEWEVE